MQEFDVVVVGGGASGLRAAIAAKRAGASVGLISKVHPLRTNSAIAQGGLNAPLGNDDSPESFAEDTLAAGDGLCDRAIVQTFVQEAAKDVIWLERMGVPFNRDNEGRLDRRPFGSNRRNRTCYADDRTGHMVLQVLHEQFQREQIPSFEEWFVTSLVIDAGSPGPFERKTPSGFIAKTSLAEVEAGTTVTRQPDCENSRRLFILTPKS